ncbi:MAG TPA: acyl-CoA dehydrogenase, partial [Candidatus Omnitrophica bacterium]|nr:acyl-CoA dehydrogenase [Candidatus Omnitrophota bacterium]
ADMAINLEAMRHLVYMAAKDTGLNGFPDEFTSSAAKILAAEGAVKITNMAMDLFGGYGYSKEFPIERYLREAKGMLYVGGTTDVLRNAIGTYLKRSKT